VFLAGRETTTGVLGNGLLELYSARNAGQLALVRDQRQAIFPATVEEMMRHSGSVHTIWRVANEDFERSGRIIGKDDRIITVLAAANRDPDVYPDPDQDQAPFQERSDVA
jgi:cytochrome P450